MNQKSAPGVKRNLTEGSVGRHLVNLTLPMIWGVFAVIGFTVADTYFVGQLGTKPLAAMSFTFPVVMGLGNLAMGLGVGASSVIALAIGTGDRHKVQRLTSDSLTLSLITVGLFVILGLATINPLFTLLGAPPDLLPLIRDYMQIWYIGIVFVVVPMVGNSALRAAGNTKAPSIIMTVAGGMNIILDPLLIFGWGPFPRMEIQGAALTTVISQAITLVAAVVFLHYSEGMISWQIPRFKEVIVSWKSILHVGLPAAAANMVVPVSVGFITNAISSYGKEAVAGFGIASRVESFALIVFIALGSIIGPFVGQNWGANKRDRVHQALKLSCIFCLIWGCVNAAIIATFAPQIAAAFDRNPEVIAIGATYLKFVPISYAGSGIILIASATFNALGKPLPSVAITVIRTIVLYIPLAYLGSWLFGLHGIFAATCFANIAVGIGSFIWTQKTCNLSLFPGP
ncbi:MAG TPA: MATE family efflux transporter [Oscillatoriaceae cyanobacterium M33_DOE_052]|uniref:MATE family efflux transporter n=1 Tax=Planktothricoides sp. SpSt-374 TaxID=2282167 RepID=A0A7C3ZHG8_9CYAN|nr:MATE family efflux transporter [Oscillatoriaceae cyanobacterium M33_DOE_052]